ncbi:hypothetical protein BDY24DRAFT_354198 [Mrakia frigida]|uniref:uncharacterized protein n=1 Tax=Mrakia frigida TaxID=29902 RepID=UPI003FCC0F53
MLRLPVLLSLLSSIAVASASALPFALEHRLASPDEFSSSSSFKDLRLRQDFGEEEGQFEEEEGSSSEVALTIQSVSNCLVSGHVALTFDDGPYLWEKEVASKLKDVDGKGTFFLNGNNYACIYDHADTVKALFSAGHTLASHGWAHKNHSLSTYDEIHEDLEKLEIAFAKILGIKPTFYRPPYGIITDLLLEVLVERGYTSLIMWSDNSGDADGATVANQKLTYDAISKSYPAPHLSLQHSTKDFTSKDTLSYSLPLLKKVGYKLSNLDTCLGLVGASYLKIGEPGVKDESWVC